MEVFKIQSRDEFLFILESTNYSIISKLKTLGARPIIDNVYSIKGDINFKEIVQEIDSVSDIGTTIMVIGRKESYEPISILMNREDNGNGIRMGK